MINNAFTIAGLMLSILLTTIYFVKPRIKTLENKIYSYLVITNLIELILAIITYITIINRETIPLLNDFFSKLLIFSMFIWINLMSIYIYIISNLETEKLNNRKNINFVKISFFTIIGIAGLLIFILPLHYYSEPNIAYSYGSSANIIYVFDALEVLFWIVCLFKNFKNLLNKKFLPFVLFILIASIVIVIQKINPELLLMSWTMCFVTFFMYFTIENPDVKMIEQLNIAKDQADKANRAKTDFLSSMSHEIRTPLNAIVGFSECIKQSKTLDEAQDNADDIISASNTLLEIVNGILDISKIEAGKIEIHNSSYNSKELFDSIVKLGRGRLGEKPLEFRVNIAPDIPETLYGDHANVKKVIINILTNAIKYTEKGFVDLSIKCVNTNDICRLIISVEDSGRGIKEKDIDKLFTKFQRLDEDRNTTIEGTGLGLAITKQLVDLMGGKIVVNSTFGEGSKFTIALDQKISKTKVEKTEIKEFNDLDLTNKKILVVDDNKLNLKVATKILEKYKPTIETVESGMECLDKINSGNKYDLILMDDMMPRMSGTETLLRLKQIENFNTPVIALTANAISGMEEKYLKDGFNGYLAKPIDRDKLHEVLVKFIHNEVSEKTINNDNKLSNESINNEVVNKDNQIENKIEEVLDLTNKKILVVDDNKLNIKVANTFLKKYNPIVEEVYSGIECINKIKEGNRYDLIFMDDMMPEVSGVETFHELEKIENFNIPVVVLTANAIDGMREQYLKEGFNEYLSKPINKDELDRILNLILKNDNPTKEEIKESIQPEVNKTIEKSVLEIPKQEEIIEQSIENKPRFEELPEELFEINDSIKIAKPEKNEEIPKKEEVYKEKIETPKQFSPVYITKDEYKNDTNYLKENNIDVDHGIELLGDLSMYNETMEEFYNNIRERVIKLRTFKENNDLANYAIEAHALKSDSKYLGFTELAQKSFDHEIKAKENNIEFVNNDFDRLLNSLNRVLNIIKKYLGK